MPAVAHNHLPSYTVELLSVDQGTCVSSILSRRLCHWFVAKGEVSVEVQANCETLTCLLLRLLLSYHSCFRENYLEALAVA